jgi:hypothetical protein
MSRTDRQWVLSNLRGGIVAEFDESEAYRIYREALESGSQPFRKCKLLLVGAGRAGKTSLWKVSVQPHGRLYPAPITPDAAHLMGLSGQALAKDTFRPDEPSTEVFDVSVLNLNRWQKEPAGHKHLEVIGALCVAQALKERSTKLAQDRPALRDSASRGASPPPVEEPEEGEGGGFVEGDEDNPFSAMDLGDTGRAGADARPSDVGFQQLPTDLIRKIVIDGGETVTVSISGWDFAGE